MNSPVYSIKCPGCASKAAAYMYPNGNTGSYREVFIKMGVRRIACVACGFLRVVPPEESGAYELWYAADFKGHRLWARNRSHLAFLISWISGNRSRAVADRSAVEAFPKWMILAKNRAAILKCLNELRSKDVKTAQRTGTGCSTRKTKRRSSTAGSRR